MYTLVHLHHWLIKNNYKEEAKYVEEIISDKTLADERLLDVCRVEDTWASLSNVSLMISNFEIKWMDIRAEIVSKE